MAENLYKITKKDLLDLFGRLSDNNRVIVPYIKGELLYLDDFDPKKEDLVELGGIRQSQPLKSFINPAREKIFRAYKPMRNIPKLNPLLDQSKAAPDAL